MIKDGIITYSNSQSPFLWWEPEHSTLNTLFIGLLTAFLSLQATSLVFDLLFGLKTAGHDILSDIHSLLLVWSSSPSAIWNAISNRACLGRCRYKCELSKNAADAHYKTGIRKRVLAKLFMLLAAGPIINIVAVAIVHESETTLTIRESGFGALGWGVNTDLSVAESHHFTEACKQYNISTGIQDQALVEFFSCDRPFFIISDQSLPNEARISVAVINQTEIAIITAMFGWQVWAFAISQLFTKESLFQSKHALTQETASFLVDKGIELVAEDCLHGDEQGATISILYESPEVEILRSKTLPCRQLLPVSEEEATEKAKNITGKLREYLTFVNAEKLELFVKDENTMDVSAADPAAVDNISFLIRRQRNLSVPLVVAITAFLFGLRILTTFFLNNDVSVAVELAVKRELGIRASESLLKDGSGDVFYGNCSKSAEKVGGSRIQSSFLQEYVTYFICTHVKQQRESKGPPECFA